MKHWTSLACLISSLAVSAQQRPATNCPFTGFTANPKLGQTVISSVAYYGCGLKPGCFPKRLRVGQPVVIFQVSGDWICGYVEDTRGTAPAWIPTRDVREMKPDLNPAVAAWLGRWSQEGDHLELKPIDGGKILLMGHSTWRSGDIEHSGDLKGEVTPSGHHIHYSEGPAACTVDLTLFGKYIVANDNDQCGGTNVRFWGIWKRDPR